MFHQKNKLLSYSINKAFAEIEYRLVKLGQRVDLTEEMKLRSKYNKDEFIHKST